MLTKLFRRVSLRQRELSRAQMSSLSSKLIVPVRLVLNQTTDCEAMVGSVRTSPKLDELAAVKSLTNSPTSRVVSD